MLIVFFSIELRPAASALEKKRGCAANLEKIEVQKKFKKIKKIGKIDLVAPSIF
jgi:hypothetical protein